MNQGVLCVTGHGAAGRERRAGPGRGLRADLTETEREPQRRSRGSRGHTRGREIQGASNLPPCTPPPPWRRRSGCSGNCPDFRASFPEWQPCWESPRPWAFGVRILLFQECRAGGRYHAGYYGRWVLMLYRIKSHSLDVFKHLLHPHSRLHRDPLGGPVMTPQLLSPAWVCWRPSASGTSQREDGGSKAGFAPGAPVGWGGRPAPGGGIVGPLALQDTRDAATGQGWGTQRALESGFIVKFSGLWKRRKD